MGPKINSECVFRECSRHDIVSRSSVQPPPSHYTIVNHATPFHTAHMEVGGNACLLWKNSGLCLIHLIVPWFSFPVWMKGEMLALQLCFTPRWKYFHVVFLLFHFPAWSSKIHSCQFNWMLLVLSSTSHRDGACCQKMTNCPKYALKYAITLSISCLVIVFLDWGENGPGQFNFSGLFLIRPQAAFMLVF